MSLTRRRRGARAGRVAVLALLVMQGLVSAQDVTEPALKAAYIYNFAKFTEWPAATGPARDTFVLCVVGDVAVGQALVRAVKDRALGGVNLSVSLVTSGDPPPNCRLIYISGVAARQTAQLLGGLRDQPVLTIGDLQGFNDLGGIARFFFHQGQLRFSVNTASAERAHLRISSKLLALATREAP
jgi:hypothetical protein